MDYDPVVQRLRGDNQSLSEELQQCQADKDFVWSLWRKLQVANPDITQAVGTVVQREKEKAELKDRKVLEILQIKDDKIEELHSMLSAQGRELQDFKSKRVEQQNDFVGLKNDNNALQERLSSMQDQTRSMKTREQNMDDYNRQVINEIQSEKEVLQKQLLQQERLVKSLEKQTNDLRSELKSNMTQKNTAEVQCKALQKDISNKVSQFEDLLKDIDNAKRLVQKLEAQNRTNLMEIEEKNRELETVRKCDPQSIMTFTAQKAHWQIATYTLTVVSVVLFIALLAVWTTKDRQLQDQYIPECPSKQPVQSGNINNNEPGVLAELTPKEIQGVLDYLFTLKELALTPPDKVDLNSSFIFYIEHKPPSKVQALAYLDGNGSRPAREASVMVFRGDLNTPVVVEYVVGSLPYPSYYRTLNSSAKQNHVPYNFRAFTVYELANIEKYIIADLKRVANDVLIESYGASILNCGLKCLTYSVTPISSAFLNPGKRASWLSLMYKAEFSSLHHVDFQLLVDTTSRLPEQWSIDKIWYANQMFDSLGSFVQQYKDGVINKSRFKFPSEESLSFGSLQLGDDPYPKDGSRGPHQFMPDGSRYEITGNNIKYMKWNFNYSMSPSRGIKFLDVRFQEERILYELGMEEVAVLYSGHSPAAMYSYVADGAGLFGTMPKGLVRGHDCPEYATYLNSYMFSSKEGKAREFRDAICVFEHNNQLPLRRHKAFDHSSYFYGALSDNVLIVRVIILVVHYDYIYDFIFHLNGALEVRVSLTGYLVTNFYYPQEEFFGTRVADNVVAGIHNHLFHFKVDLDIKGVNNRFETLDITLENTTIPWSLDKDKNHMQKMITWNLKTTEQEALYKYNFDTPKYLLFHNKNETNYGNRKAYRLLLRGMSKSLLSEDYGFEKSIPWARYQVAVTKHKDEEDRSSSVFSMWDGRNPVVNFQSYVDDDEDIVDQDLVSWVTLGAHHIPHTEDIPNTATTGNQLSFFLIPHNYYQEDPSMSVRNAVFISPKDKNNITSGAKVEFNGIDSITKCVPSFKNTFKNMDINASQLFG